MLLGSRRSENPTRWPRVGHMAALGKFSSFLLPNSEQTVGVRKDLAHLSLSLGWIGILARPEVFSALSGNPSSQTTVHAQRPGSCTTIPRSCSSLGLGPSEYSFFGRSSPPSCRSGSGEILRLEAEKYWVFRCIGFYIENKQNAFDSFYKNSALASQDLQLEAPWLKVDLVPLQKGVAFVPKPWSGNEQHQLGPGARWSAICFHPCYKGTSCNRINQRFLVQATVRSK